MYKTRLQELCHKKLWNLPSYSVEKDGPDHNPSFSATVTVNGISFATSNPSKSSKLAQNEAALLAYQHFSGDPSAPLQPAATCGAGTLSVLFDAEGSAQHKRSVHNFDTSATNLARMPHIYKNQLQTYAQKRNLNLPIYSCQRKGTSATCCYKGMVTVDGQTFESSEIFPSIKDAENAAARAALMILSPDKAEEDECGLAKNLLQELAQRRGLNLPYYVTRRSGEDHMPTFVSTVKIGGETFMGQEAKTKKLAEIDAAKVAFKSLRDSSASGNIVFTSPDHKGQELHGSVSSSKANDSSNLQQDVENEVTDKTVIVETNCQPAIRPSKPNLEETNNPNMLSSGHITNNCFQDQQDPCPPNVSVDGGSRNLHPDPAPPVLLPGNRSSPCKRINIHPRAVELEIEGGAVLSISDDKWVAVESDGVSVFPCSNNGQ